MCSLTRSLTAQSERFETLAQIPPSAWPVAEPLRRDTSAVEELTANRKAMEVQTWGSVKADGAAVLGRAQNSSEAHLLLSGDRSARLEINDPSGTSMIMVDEKGGFLRTSNRTLLLDPQPFAINSIPLQLLLASYKFKALLDRGIITLDGVAMHRVTTLLGSRPGSHGQERPIDLYFDPATHLLLMSVAGLNIPGSGNELRQVTRYENYRDAESIVFPHLIKQYVDGQPLWILAISSVKVGPKLDSSSFTIEPGR